MVIPNERASPPPVRCFGLWTWFHWMSAPCARIQMFWVVPMNSLKVTFPPPASRTGSVSPLAPVPSMSTWFSSTRPALPIMPLPSSPTFTLIQQLVSDSLPPASTRICFVTTQFDWL